MQVSERVFRAVEEVLFFIRSLPSVPSQVMTAREAIEDWRVDVAAACMTGQNAEDGTAAGGTLRAPEAPSLYAIAMHLYCPMCHKRHIDEGDFATRPHHTHACQNRKCGHVWRPAVVCTVGVWTLPGFLNEGK